MESLESADSQFCQHFRGHRELYMHVAFLAGGVWRRSRLKFSDYMCTWLQHGGGVRVTPSEITDNLFIYCSHQ